MKNAKDKIRIILMILLFIVLMLLLYGCSPFLQVDTNIPLLTTTLIFINNTNSPLSFFIDGVDFERKNKLFATNSSPRD